MNSALCNFKAYVCCTLSIIYYSQLTYEDKAHVILETVRVLGKHSLMQRVERMLFEEEAEGTIVRMVNEIVPTRETYVRSTPSM